MISIIIPTYNRAYVISRAINSVISQSAKDWELIIVDDGSSDNTEEVVSEFLSDHRIKYAKKGNSGAADSRNYGVHMSRFSWIAFLDSDDEVKANWMSTAQSFINSDNLALFSCGAEIVDSTEKLIDKCLPKKNKIFDEFDYLVTISGSFFILKTVFLNAGGYEASLPSGQHTEMSYRLISYIIQNNLKTKSTQEIFVRIHFHKGERIRSNRNAIYSGTKYIVEKYFDLLKKDPETISSFLTVLAFQAFKLKKNKKEILKYQYMSIKFSPFTVKKYLQLVRYLVAI